MGVINIFQNEAAPQRSGFAEKLVTDHAAGGGRDLLAPLKDNLPAQKVLFGLLSRKIAWVPLERLGELVHLPAEPLYRVLSLLEDMDLLQSGHSQKVKYYKIKNWRSTFQGYVMLELSRDIPLRKKHYLLDGVDEAAVLVRMGRVLAGSRMQYGLTGVFPHDYARDPALARGPHHFHVGSGWETDRVMQALRLRECVPERANVVLLLDQCPLGLEMVIRRVKGQQLCGSLQVYLDFLSGRVGNRVDPEQLWRRHFPVDAALN